MSLQYVHLLIPQRTDFAPQPKQVAAFLEGLGDLGSMPLEATYKIGKLSRDFHTGVNPVTGEKLFIPRWEFVSLASLSDLDGQLAGLNEYKLELSGQGPAQLPPFRLYTSSDSGYSEFNGKYGYSVRCCLRKAPVSTCETPPFGSPCSTESGRGVFRHPTTGALMEVPNAACARFWIEFLFGKLLLPKIDISLNLLDPAILATATERLETKFAQGCMSG